MAKLFQVESKIIKDKLNASFKDSDFIDSKDIFEIFVKALLEDSNMLDEKGIKAIVFNQFSKYSGFDDKLIDLADNCNNITETTQSAIEAIEKKDNSSLKESYSQLKEYQKKILELEHSIYTDDLTTLKNQKYFINNVLSEKKYFRNNGFLLELSIENFQEINSKGHLYGDIVLKYIAKILKDNFKLFGVPLIRFYGSKFIVVVDANKNEAILKKFSDMIDIINAKTFKHKDSTKINIKLISSQKKFSKGSLYTDILA